MSVAHCSLYFPQGCMRWSWSEVCIGSLYSFLKQLLYWSQGKMRAQFLIFTVWLFLPVVGSYYVIWHLSMRWIVWHWHLFSSCILSALNKALSSAGCGMGSKGRWNWDCFHLLSALPVEAHLQLVTQAIRARSDPLPVSSRLSLSVKGYQ